MSAKAAVFSLVKERVVTLLLLLGLRSTGVLSSQQAPASPIKSAPDRLSYKLDFDLDLEHGAYTGSERVRWTNHGDHGTSVVFFHLYSNVRSKQPIVSAPVNPNEPPPAPDEPTITVSEVRSIKNDAPLLFSLDDQGTTLRVNLHEAVPPDASIDLFLKFKGTVPEIDVEETGLVTHVIKQLSAAIKSEREIRRARELNFRSRGVMFVGTAFPLLVVRDGDEWRRKVERNVGDFVFSEVANFDVAVRTSTPASVFTSAPDVSTTGN